MEVGETLKVLESYDLLLVIVGLAVLAMSVLPRLFSDKPVSPPMVLLGLGFLAFALPLGLKPPDPLEQGYVTERLTELGVIVALMGAVIAPTDPVLATEVQVGAPGEGYEEEETEKHGLTGEEEDEVRFSLTSEAGLNDGLAFPFTYAAIAMAMASPAPQNWIVSWILIDVGYKLVLGLVLGLAFGWLMARTILAFPAKTELAKAITGLSALAATLIVYGATDYVGGYGFIAVFVAACAMRNYERDHEYHGSLHMFAEQTELLITAGILIALGGAIAGGLLAPLTRQVVLVGILLVFVVRPAARMVGSPASPAFRGESERPSASSVSAASVRCTICLTPSMRKSSPARRQSGRW